MFTAALLLSLILPAESQMLRVCVCVEGTDTLLLILENRHSLLAKESLQTVGTQVSNSLSIALQKYKTSVCIIIHIIF